MSAYTTNVDISNRALQLLGASFIATMADQSRNAVQCNFIYDKVRQAELRAHVWNFAISYATLASPATTFTYQNGQSRNAFTRPADFLRFADQNPRAQAVVRQNTLGGVKYTDYSIEGSYLVTALGGPIHLRYVQDVTTVTAFDPMFSEALAARMAIGMAEIITQDASKKQLAEQWYTETVQKAQLIDLIEAGGDEPLEGEVMTATISKPPPQTPPTPVRPVR